MLKKSEFMRGMDILERHGYSYSLSELQDIHQRIKSRVDYDSWIETCKSMGRMPGRVTPGFIISQARK